MRQRIPWFIPALAAVLALAVLWPAPGARGGWLHAEVTTKAAVCAIFFLQGLVLPTAEIRHGLWQWRRHVVIQAGIFLMPGLLAAALLAGFGGGLNPALRVGLMFLGLVPTTVSSAVVFTGRAHGHVALALCNSTLANLLGVFLVPALIAVMARETLGPVDTIAALKQIGLLILTPVAVGQIFHPWAWRWLHKVRREVGETTSGIVLFIVYCTFADAVAHRFWESCGPGELARVVMLTIVFGLGAAGMAILAARQLRWPRADALALFFCATQKTVAAGVPMAQSLFGHTPAALGLILLPLLCYCPLQFLLAAGAVAWAGDKPPEGK